MITDAQFEKAARVLGRAKVLDQRMPHGDELMIETWAGALFARVDWPISLLDRVVCEFYADTHDERITVGAIVSRCRKKVADAIGRESAQERDRRMFEQDRRLGLDTSWYQPSSERREISPEARDAVREIERQWST